MSFTFTSDTTTKTEHRLIVELEGDEQVILQGKKARSKQGYGSRDNPNARAERIVIRQVVVDGKASEVRASVFIQYLKKDGSDAQRNDALMAGEEGVHGYYSYAFTEASAKLLAPAIKRAWKLWNERVHA